jgi:hypothetical protein
MDKNRVFSHDVNTMLDVFIKQRKNLPRGAEKVVTVFEEAELTRLERTAEELGLK